MLWTPKRAAACGFSSMFSLTALSRPAHSVASASTTGATARQGPHQGAQKSTRTGMAASRSSAKLVSVPVTSHGSGALHLPQRGTLPAGAVARRFFASQAGQMAMSPLMAPFYGGRRRRYLTRTLGGR